VRTPILIAAMGLLGCGQYHPTAPDHIRPATERDKEFAAKVGDEAKRRRVVNEVEERAGPTIEPWIKERPDLEAARISVAGPVAVIEGTLDQHVFAGVYWVRGGQIIRTREFVGEETTDSVALDGSKRSRGSGDLQQLRVARAVVSGKRDAPPKTAFAEGAFVGDRTDLDARVRGGKRIVDGWSVGRLAFVMTADDLWVFRFERERVVEARRYAAG
jgi:hypothetical protein